MAFGIDVSNFVIENIDWQLGIVGYLSENGSHQQHPQLWTDKSPVAHGYGREGKGPGFLPRIFEV